MWISPIFFSLFSLSFACCVGENRSALFFLFFSEMKKKKVAFRERDCWEKRFPPGSFFFRSFSLSLSFEEEERKVCRRRNPKERSRIFGERVNQRDLIREEISSTESARISVSFSVLSIIIANDLLTLFHIKRRLATTTNE